MRDKTVHAHNEHKVKELSEGLSDLGEETKGLKDKVPQLENVVSYLSAKLHEERLKYNETIVNVEKSFSGLLSKIGALEGVIHDLHMHHEQHEEEHFKKEQRQSQEAQEDKEGDAAAAAEGNVGIGSLGGGLQQEDESDDDVSTVLLIVASPHRPDYLKKSLTYIANYHPKYVISKPVKLTNSVGYVG